MRNLYMRPLTAGAGITPTSCRPSMWLSGSPAQERRIFRPTVPTYRSPKIIHTTMSDTDRIRATIREREPHHVHRAEQINTLGLSRRI